MGDETTKPNGFSGVSPPSRPRRVIIDTDPGIDDTFALLLALGSQEEISIDALTIVMGNNNDVELLGRNACRILSWAGKLDIPVILGASVPLYRPYSGHSGIKVHGQDGFGNVLHKLGGEGGAEEFPQMKLGKDGEDAAAFIVRHCRENSRKVSLITLGPLTNVGKAFELDPELHQAIPHVYIMGGAVNRAGNKTPVAEANFHNDPEAARIVLNCGVPVTLASLNVTTQLELSDSFRQKLRDNCGAMGRLLHDGSQHYVDLLRGWGNPSIPVHDPTAVMALIRPDLFETVEVYCSVETKGELTSGVVVPDFKGHFGGKTPLLRLLTKVKAEEFMEEFFSRLKKASAICEENGRLIYA